MSNQHTETLRFLPPRAEMGGNLDETGCFWKINGSIPDLRVDPFIEPREIILPVFTHLGEEDGIDLGTVLDPG